MRKINLVMLTLFFLFRLAWSTVPLIQIGEGKSVNIDGKLNDISWQKSAVIFPFIENMGKGLAETQTHVKLFYNKKALYVAFICDEPHLDQLKTEHLKRDTDVWRDDCVELHILSPDKKDTYHILVNSLGITDDRKSGDYTWDPALNIVSFKNTDAKQWGIEMEIPWTELGFSVQRGDSIAMNFTRMRQYKFERSAWNATYGTFNSIKHFGEIVFAEQGVIPKQVEVGSPQAGVNYADILIDFPGDTKVKVSGNGGQTVLIKPQMKQPFKLPYVLGLTKGDVVLLAQRNSNLLWRAVFPGNFGDVPKLDRLKQILNSINAASLSIQEIKQLKNQAVSVKKEMEIVIQNSIKSGKAIPLPLYKKINKAVDESADNLSQKLWIVWTKNSWDNVSRNEIPASLAETKLLKFNGLVNEYFSGNFIITNFTNKALRIRLIPGNFIWQDKVTFNGMKPELLIADWQDVISGETIADPLIPLNAAGRLDIPSGESRQVWITLPARDIPPGNYKSDIGILTIGNHETKGSAILKKVKLDLQVEPLRISTSPDFAVYNWDYASTENYVKDLFEHKVTYYLSSTSMPLPRFDKEGNALTAIDYSKMDAILRIKLKYARKAGGKILFSYGLLESFDTAVKAKYNFTYRSPAWDRAFRFAYTNWLDHLKKLGMNYDDFYVQVWDEALLEEVDNTIKGCKLMREIDPNVKLVMDGSQNINELMALDPYIDVWIPHLDALLKRKDGKELLNFYHNVNEPVFGYTCNINMKSQDVNDYHRLKPWYAASLDLDGVFYWAYNSWRGDPWNDYDGVPEASGVFYSDCGAVYNGIDGPITSRRWEASREGIEDWQLIRLVENIAAQKSVKSDIDQIVLNVISQPDSNTFADKGREKIMEIGLGEVSKNPLKIENAKGLQKGKTLTVSFNANHKTSGKLLYRVIGTNDWESEKISSKKKHKISLSLPPEAQADWIILVWDEQGRVAYKKMR